MGLFDSVKKIWSHDKAIDLGINFIDCANVYGLSDNRERAGTSETILGQAIKGKRDDLIITSSGLISCVVPILPAPIIYVPS